MNRPYQNQLSIKYRPKGIPYGGSGELREDGDANYGFKDLKSNPSLAVDVPELKKDQSLLAVVQAINDPQTGLFSVGCVSGAIEDANGFRHGGYVEFSINSIEAIADAQNYFSIFFNFDRMLHHQRFSRRVQFDWELQPATFIELDAMGFTCAVTVNTYYSKTKGEAEKVWDEALGILGEFLRNVPRTHKDVLFGD